MAHSKPDIEETDSDLSPSGSSKVENDYPEHTETTFPSCRTSMASQLRQASVIAKPRSTLAGLTEEKAPAHFDAWCIENGLQEYQTAF